MLKEEIFERSLVVSVFQLVYPHDVKLTEKEVTSD